MNDKTVIRTGFGISYAPFPDNKYAWDNYPVKQNNVYNANCSSCVAVLPSGQFAKFENGFPAFVPAPIPDNGVNDPYFRSRMARTART